MGDDKAWHGVGRIAPVLEANVVSSPAQDNGTDFQQEFAGHSQIDGVFRAAMEHPFVEPVAAHAHGILQADVRTGNEAVQRH